MLDHIIYGAIGFVLGGVIGGAVVGRMVTSDLKKRLDELEERNKLLVDEIASLRDEKNAERQKKLETLEKETKLDNYNSLRKRYISNDDLEEEDEDDDLIEESDDSDDSKKIKMISEQQFNEEINYRDHEELTYYQTDGILVDSANDIVIEEETIVGSEIMDIIDDTKNDNLYALNNELNKVYDITIEHDLTYMRDNLGIM